MKSKNTNTHEECLQKSLRALWLRGMRFLVRSFGVVSLKSKTSSFPYSIDNMTINLLISNLIYMDGSQVEIHY